MATIGISQKQSDLMGKRSYYIFPIRFKWARGNAFHLGVLMALITALAS